MHDLASQEYVLISGGMSLGTYILLGMGTGVLCGTAYLAGYCYFQSWLNNSGSNSSSPVTVVVVS